MTVPDTLHAGLQNRTGTGYFGTRAGTQNKACLSTELRSLSLFLSPTTIPPSRLLPELEQELIVLVMVSGGGIDQR